VDFRVYREGDRVGHHRVVYAREGSDYLVRTDIAIQVTALGMPVFQFTHTAEEVWREGWLHALSSDTDDDGTTHSIRAERNGEGIFEMQADGKYQRTIGGYIIPSSLWHRDTIHSQGLLDTIDGHIKLVHAYRIGERQVIFQGEEVTARGYAVVGQINRKVWYGQSCELVRVAFLARDGSEIVLETG
jgi:hypothetical protein